MRGGEKHLLRKLEREALAFSLGFPSAYVPPLHIIGDLPPPQWRFPPLQ